MLVAIVVIVGLTSTMRLLYYGLTRTLFAAWLVVGLIVYFAYAARHAHATRA